MYKVVKILALALLVAFVASPLYAQDPTPVSEGGIRFSGAFSAGLVVIGAAMGIGKLASAALESMARQPEVAGSIQTAMIIAAALIEGFTFYALFICSTGV